ncbi:MAG: hypothetical protein ABEJ83_05535 [Candidatus Nanohaloarchaea archaeon]
MSFGLVELDLVLTIFLKFLAIVFFIGLIILLNNVDRVVRSLERSADSLEETTDTVESFVRVMRKVPFVGGGKNGE